MQASKSLKTLLTVGIVLFSTSIFAVTPDEEEDKKCIKPKFRDFAPANHTEVNPGSELTFHVSHNADPTKITADAKGQKLTLNIKDRKIFFEVKSQLPKELNSPFVRINTHAKSNEGECIGQDGWLLKIKTPASEAIKTSEAQVAH